MLARLLPRCATATAQRSALRSAPLRCGSSSVRSLHSIGEVDGVHPSHSSGVLVGPGCKTVYLSSQPGVDAAGTVPAGAAEQAELAFGAVELLLADVGMTAKDVVKINAFVTDRDDIAAYTAARDEFLATVADDSDDELSFDEADVLVPASTLLVVSGFANAESKVEVEVVAAQARPAKEKKSAAAHSFGESRGGGGDGGGRRPEGGFPTNPGKLFVGGLAWGTDDFVLREAFEEFGEVTDAVVLMDKFEPDKSRGFGFVSFASPDDAKMAADEMDGQMLDGRALRVNMADSPPPPRRGGGGGGGGYGGGGRGGGGGGYGGGGGRGGGGGGRGGGGGYGGGGGRGGGGGYSGGGGGGGGRGGGGGGGGYDMGY